MLKSSADSTANPSPPAAPSRAQLLHDGPIPLRGNLLLHLTSRLGEAFMSGTLTPTSTVAAPQRPSISTVIPLPTTRRDRFSRKGFILCASVGVVLIVGLVARARERPAVSPPILKSVYAARQPSFEEYFQWAALLRVEENEDAMVVKPVVSEDSSGGLLVADSRESQVRRLSSSGSLLGYFGRPGDGPREFRSLSSVVRLRTGELLTTEISGRVTLTDREGEKVVRVTHVPVQPLLAATVLDDSTVILSGLSDGNLVHLWDPHRLQIRTSFYSVPEHREEHAPAYSFTGFPAVAVRGDTIAVLFSLSDELRFFTKNGAELSQMRLRLPYRNFRGLREGGPADASPEAFRAWAESYSVGSRIYWMGDGSFIIQYFDRVGSEQKWSMLHVDREGRNLFEGDTPKLLTVLRNEPEPRFLFDAADNAEPNQWRLANFR